MVSFLEKQSKDNSRFRIVHIEKSDRLCLNLKDYVFLDEIELEIHLGKEAATLSADSHSQNKAS